jgi:hypothetical protein
MRFISTHAYFVVFFSAAILGGSLSYIGTWTWKFAACGPVPQRSDVFLAECSQQNFGDFEHAVYQWNLEPSAIRSLQAAEVIFLGNSRMQFAFSTHAVDEFFSRNHIPYYAFGFGYEEPSKFPMTILKKYGVRPKAYIINADPFFKDQLSEPAKELENASYEVLATYAVKFMFVEGQRLICSLPRLCMKSEKSLYRAESDGTWIWQNNWLPGALAHPIKAEKLTSLSDDELSRAKTIGFEFLGKVGVPSECVILTGVPTSIIDSEALASEIGKALNLQVVLAHLNDLNTLDETHLNADSAERWASVFIANVAPVLAACLSRNGNVRATSHL